MVSETPDDLEVRGELPARSRSEWFWRRLPSTVGWDGLFPLVSPLCAYLSAQASPFVQSVVVTFVPMGVALARAKIGRRQIERACGNGDDTNRQLALGGAIVLLLALEVFTSIALLGKPGESWERIALIYAGYMACISFALRRPKRKVAEASAPVCDHAQTHRTDSQT